MAPWILPKRPYLAFPMKTGDLKHDRQKLVIAAGGASGAWYTKLLFDRLLTLTDQWERIGVTYSENALTNWQLEVGSKDFRDLYPFDFYERNDFRAPFASGSAQYQTMIIIPCSMGLLGRIAQGVSDDLTTRAADVMLKERRRLILVPRETPLSLIHLENMTRLTRAGAIVCPAIPSLYSHPQGIDDLLLTVVDRVLDLAGFHFSTYRWQEGPG